MNASPILVARTPHALHDPARHWPETNCYVDLWIELLDWLGYPPEAALAFTVAQAFEGDQLTFFKVPQEDLRVLYGLQVAEVSIHDTLERHLETWIRRGAVLLVEVDAFYLPDTAATSYRREHAKTTIGIHAIDAQARSASYFHNASHALLDGQDYAGALRLLPALAAQPDLLPPYVESVQRSAAPLEAEPRRAASLALLRRHLSRRPTHNPFSAWRAAFDEQLQELLSRPARYHAYAFNFTRQGGANFELLASYADWLDAGALGDVAAWCRDIAATSKVLQFRLARAVARGRPDACDDCFDRLEHSYRHAIERLVAFAG